MSVAAETPWWTRANVYQVYLRSFQDSDGDGIGDLDGARSRLPELAALGIDTIWLSPVHPSPNADFGYDVADYDAVASEYGGMPALDRFIDAVKGRGMRVLLDGVFNHTSIEHRWFTASRSAPEGPLGDWYHWHDGPRPPNNWASTFGGPAWSRDPLSGRWYLHSFAPEQADLNWGQPAVEQAILDSMRRWFERGVDGFRLDVFNNYAKHLGLVDNPWRTDPLGRLARLVYPFAAQDHVHDRDRPELAAILGRMRALADAADGPAVLVGETLDERLRYDRAADWCGPTRLHTAFHFRWLHTRWSAAGFHAAIAAQLEAFDGDHTPAWVLGNHDFTRLATRWGAGAHTDARMRLVPLLQLGLPGMVVVYQGDELGTPEARLPRAAIQDPPGQRFWPFYKGRDGCRTPMAWTRGPHAGFTAGTPWLPLHPDHPSRNVEAQRARPTSVWSTYRRMLHLRRTHPALVHGDVTLPERSHRRVLTYRRATDTVRARLVANLGRRSVRWTLPAGENPGARLAVVGDVQVGDNTLQIGAHAGVWLEV